MKLQRFVKKAMIIFSIFPLINIKNNHLNFFEH